MTVTMAAEAGQLQLNAFEPIIGHSLFKSLYHLAAGCRTLTDRCVKGITANRARARRLLDESTALVTALTPILGYARSTEIAREALATGAKVLDLLLAKKLLTPEQVQLDWQTGPQQGVTFVALVAYTGSGWREVWPCISPDKAPAMQAAKEARLQQGVRVQSLAANMPQALRTEVMRLIAEGKKIDAIKLYQGTTKEDLTTSRAVV